MISKSKTYRTECGYDVRIYATDAGGLYPVHGAIKHQDDWDCICWTVDGVCVFNPSWSLIEVKPRHKRTVWINVYEGGVVLSEEKPAVAKMFDSRIACVKVEIDCEEGEGL